MIEESFYTWLAANAGVDVYPGVLPQDAAPAVTYARDGGTRDTTFNGVSTLQEVDFAVNCWAANYLSTRTTATTIMAALVNFRGTLGADHVDNVLLLRDIDAYEPETELHQASLLFRMFYDL